MFTEVQSSILVKVQALGKILIRAMNPKLSGRAGFNVFR